MDKKMHSEPQLKGMSPRRNLIDESKDFRIRSGPSEEAVHTDSFEDGIQDKVAAAPYSAMQFPMSIGPQGWKKRPRSPGLKWY